MNRITVADSTLKNNSEALSFNEKISVATMLDALMLDVIELPAIKNVKADTLFLHTLASLTKHSTLSCTCALDTEAVKTTADALKNAEKFRLLLCAPISTVQMEYIHHIKAPAMLDKISEVCALACSLCADVEISLQDATRAERDFLYKAISTAINAGVKTVNLCDDAGDMLPSEIEAFVSDVKTNTKGADGITLSVECSDALDMGVSATVLSVLAGAKQIKAAARGNAVPLLSLCKVIKEKGDALGIECSLNMAQVEKTVCDINEIGKKSPAASAFDSGTGSASISISLENIETAAKLGEVIATLGYELSDNDIKDIYSEFCKAREEKPVTIKKLEMIIAETAMQVAPTYKLVSYVINSGNVITPTANIELERGGERLQGFCVGNGPIDAAFLAIEKITGHHFELDDFSIRSITRGYEAFGSTLVKLRHNGKIFSGSGVSTDIVGASITAYVNALNKIYAEEANI